MNTAAQQLVELEVAVHARTASAVLVSLDGNRHKARWLPRSQVELEPAPGIGRIYTLTLPEWLAIEKELV